MAEKREFKGIWIPKEVWLSDDMTLQEKVFYVEVDSLNNELGCYANNEYFSRFFGISKVRVSEVINSLVKKGFLVTDVDQAIGNKRKLMTLANFSLRPSQSNLGDPHKESFKHSNTINNTVNSINESKDSFPKEPLLFDSIPETEVPKKSKKNKEVAPDEFYPAFVQEWTQAYPELGFDGISGKKIKSLISKTKRYLENSGKVVTPDGCLSMFQYVLAYIKRANHFCHGKPITTFDSQYLSIIFEIKNGKTTSQPPSTREILRNIVNG